MHEFRDGLGTSSVSMRVMVQRGRTDHLIQEDLPLRHPRPARVSDRSPMMKTITLLCLSVALHATLPALSAEETAPPDDAVRRRTAVTLNYCRAALHRIRGANSKSVIVEEQQRILNNLDLNQIEDPEVITLYKSILDEIGTVEISARERAVIDEQFRRGMHRKLGTDLFVIGAQAATAQVGTLIQTGANSWWDYRSRQTQRDADLWKVEKQSFTAAMSRSSSFLDSFWKLSRKNNIPDRWLVRDLDLDQLAAALAETDPEVRLRKLERMDRFMECYPPYWYYLARTQQELGRLEDAELTYRKLAELGRGHFRQDDMLAGCMANLAMLQEVRQDPEAAATARRAFDHSIRNWEANLLCAWVLGRHGDFREAEDLILCNLDEDLETDQSSVALVSLFYHSDDKKRLAESLQDESLVRRIPVPGLLLCAAKLGQREMPGPAARYLSATLTATVHQRSRASFISVAASHAWKLSDAAANISDGHQTFHSAGVRRGAEGVEVEFLAALDAGQDESPQETIRLALNYPGTPAIQVLLESRREEPRDGRNPLARLPGFASPFPGAITGVEAVEYRITEVEMNGVRMSVRPQDQVPARSVTLPPVDTEDSVVR